MNLTRTFNQLLFFSFKRNLQPSRNRYSRSIASAVAASMLFATACLGAGSTPPLPAGPDWSRNLPIYEINPRQFTPEGTFQAIEKHLPELKALGVGVIWFMPIHPSGEDAKSFGSFYCVRDYQDINTNYGTKNDFKHLVGEIHKLGMYVMMDWVANHTSWDNPLTQQHPDWYQHDANGNILMANTWRDVAALNYSNHAVWEYMRDSMAYWAHDFGVDGFRCDYADGPPAAFWSWLRPELEAKAGRPLLMLAESNAARYHPTFDMTYDWNLPPLMQRIASGTRKATDIDTMLANEKRNYPAGAVRMRHTYNHDNNWSWTLESHYHGGIQTFAVLCATLPGRPMILDGQEIGLTRRLPNSTRGARAPLEWVDSPYREFYTKLLNLYQKTPALYEGEFIKVPSGNDANVYAYLRRDGAQKVVVVLNLSAASQSATLSSDAIDGKYNELFTDAKLSLADKTEFTLQPWEYRVYVGQPN